MRSDRSVQEKQQQLGTTNKEMIQEIQQHQNGHHYTLYITSAIVFVAIIELSVYFSLHYAYAFH